MKNIVLITSVIRNPRESPYLTEDERLEQTINTVSTIREKIPHSYIVLLEGGKNNHDDTQKMKSICDEIYHIDVEGLHRSIGEVTMINAYLQSEFFVKIKDSLTTLNKVSGRYYLNDKFSFNENLNSIKKDDISWSGRGACSTRYWRVTKENIEKTVQQIHKLHQSFNPAIHIDIEHAFYSYEVVPLHDSIDKMEVGVTGFVSPMGFWENG
jgi:hypothetical protein